MKYFLYGLLFLCAAGKARSQERLQGKVIDAVTHTPLFGATVSVPGSRITTTDREGRFWYDCGKPVELIVSFIGYESKKKLVKNCGEEYTVSLVPINHSLQDVEITATSTQNKSILYQPSSITKIGETELKRSTGLFLDDAINNNVPGVTMQRRAVSSGQQFNIRGYGNGIRGTNGPSSNFDGQGYKVYLNGIPVTDAEGITVMDDIDFGSIGNVEVTKGPAGTIYGLAIAGVVNMKTIKPEKGKTIIGQDVMAGSYQLRRYTTHFQAATDRTSLLVNYGRQLTDGYMIHTNSRKDFVNIAADFQPNDKQAVNLYVGYSKSYDERGGELTIAQYANLDYSGNPEYIKRNAHSAVTGFRMGAGHTYVFSRSVSNTTSVFASGISNNASSAGGWTDKTPINYGFRSVLDTRVQLSPGISLGGITGMEWQRQNAQTTGYNMVPDPLDANAYWLIGPMRSNQVTITGTSSLFTEWTLSLPHEISITAGVGTSNMAIELNDRFYVSTSTAPVKFATHYNGLVSPHLAINKVFGKKYSLYTSYSSGSKAPVSAYFFIPATGRLNTDLRPERGTQFELGSKGVLGSRLKYELAVFDATFSDKMTSIAVPLNGSVNTTAYSYVANGGSQHHRGVEMQLTGSAYESGTAFFAAVRPFLNLTYSGFTYVGFSFQTLNPARTAALIADYDGKAVAGVAPITANAGVDINTRPGIYANVTYAYKDHMPITSDGVNTAGSYNLINTKVGLHRNLSAHFDVDAFLGINNLTGTQYPYMVFVNQLPDAYLPAPDKANYFGGINVKYIF